MPRNRYLTWSCCHCGSQWGLSVSFDFRCPELCCQHERCAHCPMELSDGPGACYYDDGGGGGGGGGVCFSIPLPQDHTSKAIIELNCNPAPQSKLKEELPKRRMLKKQVILKSSQSTSSPLHAEPDGESVETYTVRASRALQSRLLEVLRCHLNLAAIILPTISSIAEGNENITSTTNNDGSTKRQSQKSISTGSSSTSRSDGRTTSNTNFRKRSGRSDENPDENPQKRQFTSSKPIDSTPATFACHFHKRDPEKHGPSNSENRRFRNCIAPRVPELRRIKDHFKAVHVNWQCESCYAFFPGADDRAKHSQLKTCEPNDLAQLKEGINNTQWTLIEQVIKARGKKHCVEKWFTIWTILFPNDPPPAHPWIQTQPQETNFCIESLVGEFESVIEAGEEDGTFRRDDEMHWRYLQAFRQTLEKHNIFASMDSPSSIGSSSLIKKPTRTASITTTEPGQIPNTSKFMETHLPNSTVGFLDFNLDSFQMGETSRTITSIPHGYATEAWFCPNTNPGVDFYDSGLFIDLESMDALLGQP